MMHTRTVLLVAAVLCLASCRSWYVDPAVEHNGPQVAVAGDSITFIASNQIAADVSPTHALVANAVIGAVIADMLPWLQSHLADSPIVVENLGTNNINHDGWQDAETSLLALLAGQPCVELVTVQHGTPGDGDPFNAALAVAAAANPNFHIVDWAAAVTADPTLVFDGVHPNYRGTVWLGTHIADAITNDCAA